MIDLVRRRQSLVYDLADPDRPRPDLRLLVCHFASALISRAARSGSSSSRDGHPVARSPAVAHRSRPGRPAGADRHRHRSEHADRAHSPEATERRFAAEDATSNAIKARYGDYTELQFETVGPTVGTSVSKNSILSVLAASVGILLYLAWAFRKVTRPFLYGSARSSRCCTMCFVVLGVFAILG